MIGQWQPYLISIVIGLLVGIERERAHPRHKAMGVRTFLLLSLLGAVVGGLNNLWLSILLTSFALGLILISYFNQVKLQDGTSDPGLTTEFAAGIIFCLAYASHQAPALSALTGPVVALVLFSKPALHRFTQRIQQKELEAALYLLLAAVVVINLVPDEVIDPWGIFNPRKFGYLVLTLGALEFGSYILVKVIGGQKGFLVIGFLGGLVSSTAVLLSSARQAKHTPEQLKNLVGSSLAAKLAALAQLLFIVGLVSPQLLLSVSIPAAAGITIGTIALFFVARKAHKQTSSLALESPLDWKGVLRLSILLAVILGLITITKTWLGEQATFAVSFLTALFELHGVSLANATMFRQGVLTAQGATSSIILAMIASLVAKIGISWIVERGAFARRISFIFILMIAAIGLVGWLRLGLFA